MQLCPTESHSKTRIGLSGQTELCHLKRGPREAVNDQTSSIRHIRVKDDIQERIPNLHEVS